MAAAPLLKTLRREAGPSVEESKVWEFQHYRERWLTAGGDARSLQEIRWCSDFSRVDPTVIFLWYLVILVGHERIQSNQVCSRSTYQQTWTRQRQSQQRERGRRQKASWWSVSYVWGLWKTESLKQICGSVLRLMDRIWLARFFMNDVFICLSEDRDGIWEWFSSTKRLPVLNLSIERRGRRRWNFYSRFSRCSDSFH